MRFWCELGKKTLNPSHLGVFHYRPISDRAAPPALGRGRGALEMGRRWGGIYRAGAPVALVGRPQQAWAPANDEQERGS